MWEVIKVRNIKVKYSGTCRKCGATLNIGDDAVYERHIGLFCLACAPKDTEEIRTYRQEAADRKADKYEGWAAKRTKDATATLNHNRTFTDDIAFNTQPGHFPLRARVIKQNDNAYESLEVANRFKEKAENLRHVRVKGDAEKKWQALRDLNLSRIKVGMLVNTGIYGEGIVQKINKKTARISNTGISGTYVVKVDLAFLSPLNKELNSNLPLTD